MFNKGKKFLSLALVLILVLSLFAGCAAKNQAVEDNNENPYSNIENKTIILSTTTSTNDSGLLDYILPEFTKETGIEAKVVAVGTGKAIKMGEDGEADVLLVHAKSSEEEFVKAGHGLERFDVMYNDFVLIGPKSDPNGIKAEAGADISKAFQLIKDKSAKFISRGDDSGTNKKELEIWKALNVTPEGDWYVSAGKGMSDVIQMANEMQGYTISDRATYLSMKDKVELEIVTEGDKLLFNQYGVIAVNPNKNDKINAEGAQAFTTWILSEKTQKLIGEFGKEDFGQSLFIPNAK